MPAIGFTQEDYSFEAEDKESGGCTLVLRGSYRNLFLFQQTDLFIEKPYALPADKKIWADLNRLSFSPEVSCGDDFILHADVDIEAVFSNYKFRLRNYRPRDSHSLLLSP